MTVFDAYESNVRSYCRSFPAIFARAKGATVWSDAGVQYIDFLAGAGALNYGHNNEYIKQRLLAYLGDDGIAQALDMHTTAKRQFIEAFCDLILGPKQLDYKIQFCGPTGTNAVEAALKLARKIKRRTQIFSFMGGYHGVSLGSLAVTGDADMRAAAGIPLSGVTFLPYPRGVMTSFDTIAYIDAILNDSFSGSEKPAAIIFETVQAESGINVAPIAWIKDLRALCDRHDLLLICDEIQTGCGRTGPFFSFERAGIIPDMVTLSKSISGYGLPMALLLMRPDLDAWRPGEHNGTFRGNQLAFVGATAALEYLRDTNLACAVQEKERFLSSFLHDKIASLDERIAIRGVGMLWGIDLAGFDDAAMAQKIKARCFERGLILETVGRNNSVIKLIPPLNIEVSLLEQGCAILESAFRG